MVIKSLNFKRKSYDFFKVVIMKFSQIVIHNSNSRNCYQERCKNQIYTGWILCNKGLKDLWFNNLIKFWKCGMQRVDCLTQLIVAVVVNIHVKKTCSAICWTVTCFLPGISNLTEFKELSKETTQIVTTKFLTR